MSAASELTGWLLDLYPSPKGGVTLWLIGEDGKRHQLHQKFPVTFYIAGKNEQLRDVWRYLKAQPVPMSLSRTERRDLFSGMTTVLAVEVEHPADQPILFNALARQFPDLTYYDADLQFSLRHAAVHGTFPLAKCKVTIDEANWIQSIEVLDSPWDLDLPLPPMRILTLEPDVDPSHAEPKKLLVRTSRGKYIIDLSISPRAILIDLQSTLSIYDPDLVLTAYGDTWLLPYLLKLSDETGLPLSLNRDADHPIHQKGARSYFAYGQVIYRGQQVHLFGRLHIDIYNAVMYHDYGLEGVWELARITSLPVQTVARVSPGTGISAMQIVTALKQSILVPWHKQQVESLKTAYELLRADMGGLVFQPIIGKHEDVAEVDFISMYPSIMVHFNISPETILSGRHDPETGLPLTKPETGLVPQTLKPLLEKRIAIKGELLTMSKWDIRYKHYKAMSSAHKWLLVTCFGYLGYKNARFGRIEAHEAVTAYGRDALLLAKEAAEDMGYEVLHLYVDGMWVKRTDCSEVKDFEELLDDILIRTGLPISLDGIYKWVAFLPSRMNRKVPVANRYFGVFQSGEIKMRGIETRRHDTPLFISRVQLEILQVLAMVSTDNKLSEVLPKIRNLLRGRIQAIREYRIPLHEFVVRQTLSRTSNEYRGTSSVATAIRQLEAAGKSLRPGQTVRFVYTLGHPRIYAWDLPTLPDTRSLDTYRYIELLMRAVETVLAPFGFSRKELDEWVFDNVQTVPLWSLDSLVNTRSNPLTVKRTLPRA
ncbi:MAG TPA: DNA polymerase domain-containing protein [Anaerolineales bacterium]